MTHIHTGSDGNHVTVWRIDGSLVAIVDERIPRHEQRRITDNFRFGWVGCWPSDDCATAHIPHKIQPHNIHGAANAQLSGSVPAGG